MTRGTGTTIGIGCVIFFIVLTLVLALVAQQFR